KRIAHLKRSMVTLPLYGKEQEVRYRSKVLMAHFLGGRFVRAEVSPFSPFSPDFIGKSLARPPS
uniref:hypothetical protein n=1 Tax=Thiolapillus sp. TaxID=2017437 RepID=UPI003AF4BB0D